MTVGTIGQVTAFLCLVYLNVTTLTSMFELVILYFSAWLQLGSIASGDTYKFNILMSNTKRSSLTIIGLYLGYLLFQMFLGAAVAIGTNAHFTNT
jgi:hypothetical protein